MKIGLISINMYPKKLNFACPLHTFAFQQFLAEQGIESTVIDYKPIYFKDFDLEHPEDTYRKRRDKILAEEDFDSEYNQKRIKDLETRFISPYSDMRQEREVRYAKFQKFIKEHYLKTDFCYDSDLLEVYDPGFDCYICVTDVIWKWNPGDGFDRGFFLGSSSMEGKWKIAYSASRGVPEELDAGQTEEFRHYVCDIDHISVREQSLKDYIESTCDRSAELVLDPVLLNSRPLYDSIAVPPLSNSEKYIVLYYVVEQADDTIRMAVDYSRTHQLRIIELGDFPDSHRFDDYPDVERTFLYDIGIEEWIGYIRDAECIFTNSFHGTCLSIIFNKRFYVGNRHGDKVANLLSLTGLEWRQITDYSGPEMLSDRDINYEPVMERLDAARDQSRAFIIDAIHRCEVETRTARDYRSWKQKLQYSMIFHSGGHPVTTTFQESEALGMIESLKSGNVQFRLRELQHNDESATFPECRFMRDNMDFVGWRIRILIDNRWFWYTNEGLALKEANVAQAKIFSVGDTVPFINVNRIKTMVAEAIWKRNSFVLHLNSGRTTGECHSSYSNKQGSTAILPSGSMEFTPTLPISNARQAFMPKNKFSYAGLRFSGWRIRIKIGNKWHWLLESGSTAPTAIYSEEEHGNRMIIGDEGPIPMLGEDFGVMVAEAAWVKKESYIELLRRFISR